MRLLLLAASIFIATPALAQTQAANPVELFGAGKRIGSATNPIMAAISSVIPSAQASSGQAGVPVELYQYGQRVGTQANPLYVNVGQALSGFAKSADLSAYLQKTGGDMTGDIYLRNGVSIYACSRSGSCANLYASGNQTLTWYGAGDINVGGGGGFSALSLGGTGNAYACLNSAGKIYRSATACQ